MGVYRFRETIGRGQRRCHSEEGRSPDVAIRIPLCGSFRKSPTAKTRTRKKSEADIMTNRKSTKRALLGSVVAMVLCLAMLVGATFAWFTDTASTGVNKIQAGNLDVQLQRPS